MALFRRKSETRLTREQALAGRPLRNPDIESTRNEDGEVVLKRPRRRTWWINLLAKLGQVPEYQTLTLDKVGSRVYEMCDGEHSVKNLIETLAQEHQLARKEAEVSMVTYLRLLAQRGLIALTVEEKDAKDADKPGEAEEK